MADEAANDRGTLNAEASDQRKLLDALPLIIFVARRWPHITMVPVDPTTDTIYTNSMFNHTQCSACCNPGFLSLS